MPEILNWLETMLYYYYYFSHLSYFVPGTFRDFYPLKRGVHSIEFIDRKCATKHHSIIKKRLQWLAYRVSKKN